jgi:hypothetical protein
VLVRRTVLLFPELMAYTICGMLHIKHTMSSL